jgi:AraC family transcriptional regulator, regulatory protein of adaptative response / methylated-DNA-[protein]-cysteine methyltransferase
MITYAFGETSIAAFLIAQSAKGIAAITIREHMDRAALLHVLSTRLSEVRLAEDPRGLASVVLAVTDFVERPMANLALPLDLRVSAFGAAVYEQVVAIPFGHTTTFTKIAQAIGRPRAARAVGNACTHNPIEFAIPCHRVLRSDGKWAGGGRWGDWRQSQIVERERAAEGR